MDLFDPELQIPDPAFAKFCLLRNVHPQKYVRLAQYFRYEKPVNLPSILLRQIAPLVIDFDQLNKPQNQSPTNMNMR